MILFGNNLMFGEIYSIVSNLINFCVEHNLLFEILLIIFSIMFIIFSIGLIILFNSVIEDLKFHIILETHNAAKQIGKVIGVEVVSGITRSAVDYGLKSKNDNSGNKSSNSGENSNNSDNSKDNSNDNKSEDKSNSGNTNSGK
jgi:hypothetical protein